MLRVGDIVRIPMNKALFRNCAGSDLAVVVSDEDGDGMVCVRLLSYPTSQIMVFDADELEVV